MQRTVKVLSWFIYICALWGCSADPCGLYRSKDTTVAPAFKELLPHLPLSGTPPAQVCDASYTMRVVHMQTDLMKLAKTYRHVLQKQGWRHEPEINLGFRVPCYIKGAHMLCVKVEEWQDDKALVYITDESQKMPKQPSLSKQQREQFVQVEKLITKVLPTLRKAEKPGGQKKCQALNLKGAALPSEVFTYDQLDGIVKKKRIVRSAVGTLSTTNDCNTMPEWEKGLETEKNAACAQQLLRSPYLLVMVPDLENTIKHQIKEQAGEKYFIPGKVNGSLAVLDTRTDQVVCHAPITAVNSKSIQYKVTFDKQGKVSNDIWFKLPLDLQRQYQRALKQALRDIAPALGKEVRYGFLPKEER